jgi:hypothetical protein
MFRTDLEERLKKIFCVSVVKFDAFMLGKEQEALFVDIDTAKLYSTSGKHGWFVKGRLSICGIAGKHKYGWAHSKIELAEKSLTAPFIFGRDENPIKFSNNNNDFVKIDMDFIYIYDADFNPISAKIVRAEITTEEEQNNE